MSRQKAPVPMSENPGEPQSVSAGAEHGDPAPEEVRRRIAETAYFLAAARDFIGGDPEQDWLEAEIMVHATIAEDRKD